MKQPARSVPVAAALLLLVLAAPALRAQGHFELSGHYGRWSLNLLGGIARDIADDVIKSEIEDRILSDIQDRYPGLSETGYSHTLAFDSRGDDFGFGFRFYPSRDGSFSLGVSVEKSTFKVFPEVTSHMDLQDFGTSATAAFDGSANSTALIKATSFLLTFRWDIIPHAIVHPYITIGGGISTAKALDDSTVSFGYSGQLTGTAIPSQTVGSEETKTLRQLKNDSDTNLPNFIPFIQLNLGVKVMITRNIHLLVDTGVFDGFMLSGGLAIRL